MDNITYEQFVRRGFKCDRGKRKGADVSFFENLKIYKLRAAQSNTAVDIRRYNDQFTKVCTAMEKSLQHSLRRMRGDVNATQEVNDLIAQVGAATSINDLEAIISTGMILYNQKDIRMS